MHRRLGKTNLQLNNKVVVIDEKQTGKIVKAEIFAELFLVEFEETIGRKKKKKTYQWFLGVDLQKIS